MKSFAHTFEIENNDSLIPISPTLKITNAIKNRVYTINNQTVFSLYQQYLGCDNFAANDLAVINFPLIFHRNGVKIGLSAEETYDDGSFLFTENIFEGETVQLGIVNTCDLLGETNSYCKSLIHLIGVTSSELNERVSLEIAKNEKNLQILLEQSRLTTMGELIDMITHQWRQPLMNMSMITSVLSIKAKMNALDSVTLAKDIPLLETQIEYLSQRIDDFRYLFQSNAHPVHTSFSEISTIFESILGSALSSVNIKLHLIIGKDSSFIIFKNQLIQALLSIIQNSKDIILQRSIKNGNITLYFDVIPATNRCYLTIQDNAGGILNKDLDNIFEPYFTTKEDKNASGLSLFIAKTIIEKQLEGTISVENTNEGAYFRIEFPTNIEVNQNNFVIYPALDH